MTECKKGEILRAKYIKSSGKIVPAKCIKSTSMYNKKAESVTTPIIKKILSKEKLAEKLTSMTSPKKCPEGTIRRVAYIRESYTKKINNNPPVTVKRSVVAASCIKDRGTPGKSGLFDPKTGEREYVYMEPGILSKYGYVDIKTKNAEQRHKALAKAYKGLNKNWLSLFRMLNYLAILNKNNKFMHSLLIADRNYVKKTFEK